MKIILLVISFLACSYTYAQTKISGANAQKSLTEKNDILLIDVRTEKEFQTTHLKNAINIDWTDQDNFEKIASNLPNDKQIYVYCKSGGRSAQAAKKLTELGYDVYDIEGGILTWTADSLPTVETKLDSNKGLSLKEYTDSIQNNEVVLVYFSAIWCGPCKELAPIIENIAKEKQDKIKVIKIDVDQDEDLAISLGIKNIPTLYIYKNGKKTWSSIGLVTQEVIESHI